MKNNKIVGVVYKRIQNICLKIKSLHKVLAIREKNLSFFSIAVGSLELQNNSRIIANSDFFQIEPMGRELFSLIFFFIWFWLFKLLIKDKLSLLGIIVLSEGLLFFTTINSIIVDNPSIESNLINILYLLNIMAVEVVVAITILLRVASVKLDLDYSEVISLKSSIFDIFFLLSDLMDELFLQIKDFFKNYRILPIKKGQLTLLDRSLFLDTTRTFLFHPKEVLFEKIIPHVKNSIYGNFKNYQNARASVNTKITVRAVLRKDDGGFTFKNPHETLRVLELFEKKIKAPRGFENLLTDFNLYVNQPIGIKENTEPDIFNNINWGTFQNEYDFETTSKDKKNYGWYFTFRNTPPGAINLESNEAKERNWLWYNNNDRLDTGYLKQDVRLKSVPKIWENEFFLNPDRVDLSNRESKNIEKNNFSEIKYGGRLDPNIDYSKSWFSWGKAESERIWSNRKKAEKRHRGKKRIKRYIKPFWSKRFMVKYLKEKKYDKLRRLGPFKSILRRETTKLRKKNRGGGALMRRWDSDLSRRDSYLNQTRRSRDLVHTEILNKNNAPTFWNKYQTNLQEDIFYPFQSNEYVLKTRTRASIDKNKKRKIIRKLPREFTSSISEFTPHNQFYKIQHEYGDTFTKFKRNEEKMYYDWVFKRRFDSKKFRQKKRFHWLIYLANHITKAKYRKRWERRKRRVLTHVIPENWRGHVPGVRYADRLAYQFVVNANDEWVYENNRNHGVYMDAKEIENEATAIDMYMGNEKIYNYRARYRKWTTKNIVDRIIGKIRPAHWAEYDEEYNPDPLETHRSRPFKRKRKRIRKRSKNYFGFNHSRYRMYLFYLRGEDYRKMNSSIIRKNYNKKFSYKGNRKTKFNKLMDIKNRVINTFTLRSSLDNIKIKLNDVEVMANMEWPGEDARYSWVKYAFNYAVETPAVYMQWWFDGYWGVSKKEFQEYIRQLKLRFWYAYLMSWYDVLDELFWIYLKWSINTFRMMLEFWFSMWIWFKELSFIKIHIKKHSYSWIVMLNNTTAFESVYIYSEIFETFQKEFLNIYTSMQHIMCWIAYDLKIFPIVRYLYFFIDYFEYITNYRYSQNILITSETILYWVTKPFHMVLKELYILTILSFWLNPVINFYNEIKVFGVLINSDTYSGILDARRRLDPIDISWFLEDGRDLFDDTGKIKTKIRSTGNDKLSVRDPEDRIMTKMYNEDMFDIDVNNKAYFLRLDFPDVEEEDFNNIKDTDDEVDYLGCRYNYEFEWGPLNHLKRKLILEKKSKINTFSNGLIYKTPVEISNQSVTHNDIILKNIRKLLLLSNKIDSNGTQLKNSDVFLNMSENYFNDLLNNFKPKELKKIHTKMWYNIEKNNKNLLKYVYPESVWRKIDDYGSYDVTKPINSMEIGFTKKINKILNLKKLKVKDLGKLKEDLSSTDYLNMYKLSPVGGLWEFIEKKQEDYKKINPQLKNIDNIEKLLVISNKNKYEVYQNNNSNKTIKINTKNLVGCKNVWDFSTDNSKRGFIEPSILKGRTLSTYTNRIKNDILHLYRELLNFENYNSTVVMSDWAVSRRILVQKNLILSYKPRSESIWGDTVSPISLITRGSLPWDDDPDPDSDIFDYTYMPETTRGVNDNELSKIPNSEALSSLFYWINDKDPNHENLKWMKFLDINFSEDVDHHEKSNTLGYWGEAGWRPNTYPTNIWNDKNIPFITNVSEYELDNKISSINNNIMKKRINEYEDTTRSLGKYMFERELEKRVWKRRGGFFGTFPARESNRYSGIFGTEYVKEFGKTSTIRNYNTPIAVKERLSIPSPAVSQISRIVPYLHNKNDRLEGQRLDFYDDWRLDSAVILNKNNGRHIYSAFEGFLKDKNYLYSPRIVFDGTSYSKYVNIKKGQKPWIYGNKNFLNIDSIPIDYNKIKNNRESLLTHENSQPMLENYTIKKIKILKNNLTDPSLPWQVGTKIEKNNLKEKFTTIKDEYVGMYEKKNLSVSGAGSLYKYVGKRDMYTSTIDKIEDYKLNILKNRVLYGDLGKIENSPSIWKDIALIRNFTRRTKQQRWRLGVKSKVGLDEDFAEPNYGKKRLKEHQKIQYPYRKKKAITVNEEPYLKYNLGKPTTAVNLSNSSNEFKNRVLHRGFRRREHWENPYDQRFLYDSTDLYNTNFDSSDKKLPLKRKKLGERRLKKKYIYDTMDILRANNWLHDLPYKALTRRENYGTYIANYPPRTQVEKDWGEDLMFDEFEDYNKLIEKNYIKEKNYSPYFIEMDDIHENLRNWKEMMIPKKLNRINKMREYRKDTLYNKSIVTPLGTIKFGNPFKEGVDVVTGYTYDIRSRMELPDSLNFDEPFIAYNRNPISDEDKIFFRNNLRNILKLKYGEKLKNYTNSLDILNSLSEFAQPQWRKSISNGERGGIAQFSRVLADLRYFSVYDPVEYTWENLPEYDPFEDKSDNEHWKENKRVVSKNYSRKLSPILKFKKIINFKTFSDASTSVSQNPKYGKNYDIKGLKVISKKLGVSGEETTYWNKTYDLSTLHIGLNTPKAKSSIVNRLLDTELKVFIKDFKLKSSSIEDLGKYIYLPQYNEIKNYGIKNFINSHKVLLCRIRTNSSNFTDKILSLIWPQNYQIFLIFVSPDEYNRLNSIYSDGIPLLSQNDYLKLLKYEPLFQGLVSSKIKKNNDIGIINENQSNFKKSVIKKDLWNSVKIIRDFLKVNVIDNYYENTCETVYFLYSVYLRVWNLNSILTALNIVYLSTMLEIQISKLFYSAKISIGEYNNLLQISIKYLQSINIQNLFKKSKEDSLLTNWEYFLVSYELNTNKKKKIVSYLYIENFTIWELKPLPIYKKNSVYIFSKKTK